MHDVLLVVQQNIISRNAKVTLSTFVSVRGWYTQEPGQPLLYAFINRWRNKKETTRSGMEMLTGMTVKVHSENLRVLHIQR